jgi:lysyl-tRNA synthetase class 2
MERSHDSSHQSAPTPGVPDDRWPDRFAAATLLFAGFVLVVSVVHPWRHYFARQADALSLVLVPVVPGFVYAALLLVLAVGLRRRLRAAWWVLVLWWFVVPEVGRVWDIASGHHVVLASVGLVVVCGLVGVALVGRRQFAVHRVGGSFRTALGVFLLGGALVLVGGAALVSVFGHSPGFGSSMLFVLNHMLADIGRVGVGTHAHAPWWVRLVVDLAGTAVVLVAATILFRAPTRPPCAGSCVTMGSTTRWDTSPPAGTSRWCGTPATRRRPGPGSPSERSAR